MPITSTALTAPVAGPRANPPDELYTVTHVESGRTVTQAAVTRDATGNITVAPALVVT